MSAKVVALRRRSDYDPELTYAQLASHLGVSKRFLQARAAEGMPHAGLDYAGRRRFLLSEVTAWLDARQQRLGRTMRAADSPLPREEAS